MAFLVGSTRASNFMVGAWLPLLAILCGNLALYGNDHISLSSPTPTRFFTVSTSGRCLGPSGRGGSRPPAVSSSEILPFFCLRTGANLRLPPVLWKFFASWLFLLQYLGEVSPVLLLVRSSLRLFLRPFPFPFKRRPDFLRLSNGHLVDFHRLTGRVLPLFWSSVFGSTSRTSHWCRGCSTSLILLDDLSGSLSDRSNAIHFHSSCA